jgi:hypothetical protein
MTALLKGPDMEGNIAKLEMNSNLYESGIEFTKACRRYGLPLFLKSIQRVAHFAWRHHPGRFADGALENLALDVGEGLKDRPIGGNILVPAAKRRASRTLHVATTLHAIGGHSRVLAKWVERNSSAEHLIVLTNQWRDPPPVVRDRIAGSGSSFVLLPAFSSHIRRAAMLRRMSQACDRVILHTHPHDCIPVLAFAKQGGPPVAMFNHAHFSFNLGSTVSDIIVNTVEYYRDISRKHRFARSTALLTGVAGMQPIDDGTVDKAAARRELSLPEDATVIMSLAYERYYTPMDGYHFFRTLKTLTENLPDAYFLIVGLDQNSPLVSDELRKNPNVRFTGIVVNPIVYYKASDLFLESFPMPSLGAVHEAVGYGEAFPIAVYGPGESILHVNQPTFSYSERALDEKAYVDYVTRQARNKTVIRQAASQMRTAMREEDRLFESKLDSLNTQIDALPHRPGKIPPTKMIDSRDCRLLADLDPSGIGDKINSLYAFLPSIYYQMDAARKGQQTPAAAVRSLAKSVTDRLREAAAKI